MKKMKPDKAQMQQMSRFAVFQRESVDVEKRTVEVAFSSEEPVERWFGDEVLSHAAGAVDLSRLNDGGAVLFNHDWDDQIGVIERAWVDADRRGRALVRFGNSAKAAEKFQDVQDGILRHISVGYSIADFEEEVSDGSRTFTATRWQPYEISFVTVPADPTVGVGRSAEPFIENPVNPTPEKGNRNMDKNQTPTTVETPAAAIPATAAIDTNNTAERGMQNERARVSELLAIGRSYAAHGGIEAAEKVIKEGGSEAQLRAAIMANMQTKPTVTAGEIGMTDKEQREFSLLRAMSAAATGKWDKAGLEREVSEELEKRHGRAAAGFFVPTDLIARAYSKGNAANGGNVIENDFREDLFIELLRNRLAVAQLGATVLDGLVGDITIPKHLTGNTVQWVYENGSASESNATFGQMSLKPKTITANTELSRKFILQSSLSAEQFARSELLKAMMLGIDLAAINGKGTSNEPTGILNTAGIGAVEIGANGGAPEWEHIVALESAIAAANADIGDLAYITNARVRGLLKTKLKADGVSGYIWQDGATPLNGYRCAVSNQIPSNLTKGTAAIKCSPLIFGNWSDLMIAHWGVLDVIVDPYTKSTAGAVRITTLQDVDIAVRHVESFAAIKDIVAA
ncbi:phage major capsid protein [Neisseria sp. HMSC064D07]|uniref:phage major capsid protein n=2 Tax=Neisseria TaxID=482 RepID=UPI0008A905B7|nr:phage major capsid protein [Neisseria sp. HMSC064D07]OHQ05582.1 major capsid protein [Neisseria sp. HMSC064D07]